MMTNELSEQEVIHLAQLARIGLSRSEIELFKQQLATVIEYNISLLSEIDTTDVFPTAQTSGLVNVWQEDEPAPSLPIETVLKDAPRSQDNQFVVPAVLDVS